MSDPIYICISVSSENCTYNAQCTSTTCGSSNNAVICQHPDGDGIIAGNGLCTCSSQVGKLEVEAVVVVVVVVVFLAQLSTSTTCSKGAFRVVLCQSSVMRLRSVVVPSATISLNIFSSQTGSTLA